VLLAVSAAFAGVPENTVTLRVSREDLPKLTGVKVASRIDYDGFSVVEVPAAAVNSLRAGKARIQEEKSSRVIGLQGHEFDVRTGPPSLPPDLTAAPAPGSPTFYLVHMAGPIKRGWATEVERAGGKIVTYIPQNTYLVWLDPARLPALDRTGFVKWKGLYHPGYKIAKALGTGRGQSGYVSVVIYDDPAGETVAKIKSLGARFVRTLDSPFAPPVPAVTAVFFAGPPLIPKIARLPRVVRLDRFSPAPGLDDEATCQIVVGHRLNGIPYSNPSYRSWLDQVGLDGSGSTIAFVDTGCDTNVSTTAHLDLRGRLATVITYPLTPDTDIAGHGTHVAGIAAGSAAIGTVDDEGFLYGQGVAPGSSLVVQNAVASSFFPPDGNWARLTRDSYAAGAFVSNNSWYSNPTPGLGYTTICATFDSLVRDADSSTPGAQPLALIFSTGNSGPGMSTILEPKESKNTITVGASENYRPVAPLGPTCGASNNIDGVADFSSRGPCLDGRYAPTLVAPGTDVASAASYSATYGSGWCTALVNPETPDYAWMSGSSMAAPVVTGALALIGQWWRPTHQGANPSPAMCKAILINGADDIAGGPDGRGGYLDHVPNGDQGWGRLNIAASINPPNTHYEDQANLLTETGQFRRYRVTVADSAKPLKITLVWSDAPGTPGAYAWANDLDLVVTGQSDTYLGNVFQSGWSTVGGSRDYKNNVECVYLPHPSGVYWVTVTAANIAADGVPCNGNPLDQDYALVIRNGIVGGTLLDPYSPVLSPTPPQPDCFEAVLQTGGWSAVGLRPAQGSDHDLSLFSDPGYASLFATSATRGDGPEFVAVDGNRAAPGKLYPEAAAYSGPGGYTIEWATHTADLVPGAADVRAFGDSDVLRAWDVEVAGPASCGIRVQPTAGTPDVGVSIFGSTAGLPSTYFRSRSESIGESDTGGPGEAETLLFQLPAAGRYGVVVWSKGGSGTYSVLFDGDPPSLPVVTPDYKYTTDLTRLGASWSSGDPETGIAKYEYEIGTLPGEDDVVGWTDAGTATHATQEGLSLSVGQDYYFTVRATNGFGMQSQASSGPILAAQGVTDIASAKALPDGSAIVLSSKTVAAAFSGRFYIEETERYAGIGVLWQDSVEEGALATVAGRLTTLEGERFIQAVAVSTQ
jgi:subtilisin family serine protease